MSKQLKQTLTDVDEKKHSLRFNADGDAKKAPFSSVYLNKKALEKVGVSPDKVKSIDLVITVHEGK